MLDKHLEWQKLDIKLHKLKQISKYCFTICYKHCKRYITEEFSHIFAMTNIYKDFRNFSLISRNSKKCWQHSSMVIFQCDLSFI